MSKVQLAGNASGTGIFQIASPNSNTDRTLTLPDATGTVQVSGNPISGTTGTFTGLLDISASGAGQIKFPAAQNASSNANTLDDYEEGSWTPTIIGTGGATGQSYGTQKGLYVKVGNLVTVTVDVSLTAKGTMTGGNVVIAGLPFNPNQYNSGGVANGSAFGFFSGLATSYIWVGWECDYNNPLMYLTGRTAAGTSVSFLDPTNISDSTRLSCSFSYVSV